MPVTVRIPTPLRQVTKGNAEVSAKGGTVDDVVADLERQFPGLKERLVDESSELRRFINIYVNEEDIRFMDGKKTALKDGDAASIVPAIPGGRQERAGFDPHRRAADVSLAPAPSAQPLSSAQGIEH